MKIHSDHIARCRYDEIRMGIHLFDYQLPKPVEAELKLASGRLAKKGQAIQWPMLHHFLCRENPYFPDHVPHLIVYRPFLIGLEPPANPDQMIEQFREWIERPESVKAIVAGLENVMSKIDPTNESMDTQTRIWAIEWIWNIHERGTELLEQCDPVTFDLYQTLTNPEPTK